MEPENENVEESTQGRQRWFIWGISIIGILALPALLFFGFIEYGKYLYQSEVQRIKEKGHPYSAETLRQSYLKRAPNRREDTSESLSESLTKLIDNLSNSDKLSVDRKRILQSTQKEWRDISRNILDRINGNEQDINRLLNTRIQLPDSDFTKGMYTTYPRLPKQLKMGTLLMYYGTALIGTEQIDRAVQVVNKLYRMGRVTRRYPTLTDFEVSINFTNKPNRLLELLLQSQSVSDNSMDVIRQTEPESMKPYFMRGLRGERAMWIITIRQVIEKNKMKGLDELKEILSMYPNHIFWTSAANFLRDYRKGISLCQRPYHEAREGFERLFERKASYINNGFSVMLNIFSALHLPAFESHYESVLKTRVRLKLLQRVLKEKKKVKEGEGKELNLQEVAKSVNDPFTGEACMSKDTPAGMVLYSTGPDMKDDGGKIFQEVEINESDTGIFIKKNK